MISLPVTEISRVAEARRACVALAQRHGFDEAAIGRVALIATELATNLVKHGGGGEIICAAFDDRDGSEGVEIIAVDKGPGIANLASSMNDGVSTSGTAGNGLGAIRRQSQGFEVFTRPGQGTIVISQLLPKQAAVQKETERPLIPTWGAISVPMTGEEVCGDAWSLRAKANSKTLMVVDGLGHGPDAAKVATEAIRLFDKYWGDEPAEIIRSLHAGLRATRGGAVAVARIEPEFGRIVYAGVGNIVGAIISGDGQTRRLISHNGTVGHNAHRIQQMTYALDDPLRSTLIMHSDGIGTGWSASAYPGLSAQHPAIIAAVLYRDFARGRDDATIAVTRAVSP